jgi:hypothetical protein
MRDYITSVVKDEEDHQSTIITLNSFVIFCFIILFLSIDKVSTVAMSSTTASSRNVTVSGLTAKGRHHIMHNRLAAWLEERKSMSAQELHSSENQLAFPYLLDACNIVLLCQEDFCANTLLSDEKLCTYLCTEIEKILFYIPLRSPYTCTSDSR